MNWKRRLELISGVITALLSIPILLMGLYIENAAANIRQESVPFGKAVVVWFLLYGLPTLSVALGAYAHAVRRQPWGRLLIITAGVFLTVWFFLSLALVVWSGLFLPAALLTVLAIATSVISLFVRGRT
jgi:hypothetical protein